MGGQPEWLLELSKAGEPDRFPSESNVPANLKPQLSVQAIRLAVRDRARFLGGALVVLEQAQRDDTHARHHTPGSSLRSLV